MYLASGVVEAAEGSCIFLTDSCEFPTEEIMGGHNFNFAPKFPENWDY